MKQTNSTQYIPGTCNINFDEIAYRRKAGYFGIVLGIIVLAPLLLLDLSRLYRLVLFVPAFIAAIGFLQAKNQFCVAYAAAGEQNALPGSKSAKKVTKDTDRLKDKLRARQINWQAAGYALLATLIAVILP